jgi:hypothetical protein
VGKKQIKKSNTMKLINFQIIILAAVIGLTTGCIKAKEIKADGKILIVYYPGLKIRRQLPKLSKVMPEVI